MPQKDENHFIREKIKEKPIEKKKLLRKGIAVAGYGALFGFISCLVFCWLKPKLEPWFAQRAQRIEIPKDTKTDEEPGQDDTQENTQQQTAAAAENGAKPKQKTVYITNKQEMTLDDFQVLQNKLYQIGNEANRSIVTVTGVKEKTDIFDSPYEATGQASGLIIGKSHSELRILTEYEVIADAKSIYVTFITGDTLGAKLKKYDGNTGIAVLSVPVERIPQAALERMKVAILGNSLSLCQGKMVVALGSPLGTNYSILTGNITSVSNTISTEDRNYTVFTTNIVSNAKGNGVLVSTKGDVIGLFLKSSGFQREQNTLTAVSVSELKDIIELLSNGENVPYIGIKGSTVTDAISGEYHIPKGVYIKEAVVNSPAMTAGLQNGDVIVEMDGEKILTMEDYQQALLEHSRGDEIKIRAQRQRTEGYKAFTCIVKVGVLK